MYAQWDERIVDLSLSDWTAFLEFWYDSRSRLFAAKSEETEI